MSSYGERLYHFRKKIIKVTQEQLGKSIGYSKNSISSMETGAAEVTDTVIYALCYKWDMNEKWFRTGEGNDLNHDNRLSEILGIFEDSSDEMKSFLLYISKGIEELSRNKS